MVAPRTLFNRFARVLSLLGVVAMAAGCGTDHSPVASQNQAITYASGETAYFALSPQALTAAGKIAADDPFSDEAYAQIPGQLESLLPILNQAVQDGIDADVEALEKGPLAEAQAGVSAAEEAVAAAQATKVAVEGAVIGDFEGQSFDAAAAVSEAEAARAAVEGLVEDRFEGQSFDAAAAVAEAVAARAAVEGLVEERFEGQSFDAATAVSAAGVALEVQNGILMGLEEEIEVAKIADDSALEDQLKGEKEGIEADVKAAEEQLKLAQEAQEALNKEIAEAIEADVKVADEQLKLAQEAQEALNKEIAEAIEAAVKVPDEQIKTATEGVEAAVKGVEEVEKQIAEVHKKGGEALEDLVKVEEKLQVQEMLDMLVQDMPNYPAAAAKYAYMLRTLDEFVEDGLLTAAQVAPVLDVLQGMERPLNRRGVRLFEAMKSTKHDKTFKVKDHQGSGKRDNLEAYFTVVEGGLQTDEVITMTLLGDMLDNLVIAFKPAGLEFAKASVLVVIVGADLVNVDDLNALVAYHIEVTGDEESVSIEYLEDGDYIEITFKIPGFSRYALRD